MVKFTLTKAFSEPPAYFINTGTLFRPDGTIAVLFNVSVTLIVPLIGTFLNVDLLNFMFHEFIPDAKVKFSTELRWFTIVRL